MPRISRWIFICVGPSLIEKRSPQVVDAYTALTQDEVVPAVSSELDEGAEQVAAAVAAEVGRLADDAPELHASMHGPAVEAFMAGASAEIFSLLSMRGSPRDRFHLLATDCLSGLIRGRAMQMICQYDLNWSRTELIHVPGFQQRDYELFRSEGVGNLTRLIDRRIKHAPPNAEVIFNATGCNRAVLPLIHLLGILFRAQVVDLDIRNGINRIMPSLPVEFSRRWFGNPYFEVLNRAYSERRRITRGQLIQKGVSELLPLFEGPDRELRLSPVGRIVLEVIRIRMRRTDWRERY
ncbi:hypothetical protein JW905_07765 [bacterium]|nr:hypothetical protein [candidate division CSSED10-310 bacterium]